MCKLSNFVRQRNFLYCMYFRQLRMYHNMGLAQTSINVAGGIVEVFVYFLRRSHKHRQIWGDVRFGFEILKSFNLQDVTFLG